MTTPVPPSNNDDSPPLTQSHYRAVLEWYESMGVDCAVSEDTTNWCEAEFTPFTPNENAISTLKIQPNTKPQNRQITTGSPLATSHNHAPKTAKSENTFSKQPANAALEEARVRAGQAKTLDDLRIMVESFEGCSLKVTATKTCFADGNGSAPLMIIGEAPGREEDITGKPFVGKAGQLLNKMLKAVALERSEDCYVTNIVFWRPPGNRNPSDQEVEICRPFLERQIELVAPKAILLLGAPAAKSLLSSNVGILKLRGKWQSLTLNDVSIPVMATLHPAYLLRTPAAKMLAWQDMLAVKAKLDK